MSIVILMEECRRSSCTTLGSFSVARKRFEYVWRNVCQLMLPMPSFFATGLMNIRVIVIGQYGCLPPFAPARGESVANT